MDTKRFLWETVLRAVNNGQQPTEEQWEALSPDEQELISMLQREKLMTHSVDFLDTIDEDKVWLKLNENRPQQHPRRLVRMRFLRYAAALAGIMVLAAAIVYYLQRDHRLPQLVTAEKYITEAVNSKRAMLVLADGRRIELNKMADSRIRQEQAEIINIDTAILRYVAATGTIQPAAFNTLIVPRGGLYKVELADGSEVWLNAETKLRYPVHFGGVSKRAVFLEKGEAYFKVKPNAAQPFIVNTGGMDVTVLGTEFNVNTYTKQYATTLAHGSVKLSGGAATAMLQPGRQAVYADGRFITRAVDVDTYTAWKDGQIIFEEAPLDEVMNSLGRQFDFDIEFTAPQLKERKFGGRLRRTEHIEDVLTVIEKAGYVQFSIKGKTILVSPVISK